MAIRESLLCVTVLALCASSSAANAQTPSGADPHWNAVVACAAQADERLRHACIDGVLLGAGVLTPERQAREQRSRFGLEGQPAAPAPVAAAPVAPAPVAPVASAPVSPVAPAMPAPAAREQASDRVDVQLAAVSLSQDKRLLVTTTEGAVWRQTEIASVLPEPAVGDTMNIRKGMLGSYFCRVGKGVAYRCFRTR